MTNKYPGNAMFKNEMLKAPNPPQSIALMVVNPQIITTSQQLVCGEEGCLSIPEQRFTIWRHQTITVRNQNLQGLWQQAELSSFISRIFQHEFDHLQGVTLFERSQMPEQQPINKEGNH